MSSSRIRTKTRLIRTALVAVGLVLWFATQSLIGSRELGDPDGIETAGRVLSRGDALFGLTAPVNRYLNEHSRAASALLIVSSLLIDLLAVFVILRSILGKSFRPFLGILMLFALRQMAQLTSALPTPDGMLWGDPGFPSLLVTYSVGNDFFFSGHTALAVFGGIELGRWGGRPWLAVGMIIAFFEAATVIVLRAHYTLDVFTGAIAAGAIAGLAMRWAGPVDAWMEKRCENGAPR